jgi:hypothetical protein
MKIRLELMQMIENTGGLNNLEKLLHLANGGNEKTSIIITSDNFENEILPSITQHIKMNVLSTELIQIHNEMTNYHKRK